jgi:hypothetical protein
MVPKKAHDEREKHNSENEDQGEGDPGEPLVPDEAGVGFSRLLSLLVQGGAVARHSSPCNRLHLNFPLSASQAHEKIVC